MIKRSRPGSARCPLTALLSLLTIAPIASHAGTTGAELALIREADLRLQSIGERLAIANAPLCRDQQAAIGMVLIALSTYPVRLRPLVARYFGMDGPSGVEAVVPGGPADVAGIRSGDTLIGLAGSAPPVVDQSFKPSTRELAQLARSIASLKPGKTVVIAVQRRGRRYDISVTPVAACAVRLEMVLSGTRIADSDGTVIRIGAPFMDELADDQLAAVVAHELAHGVLGHGALLDAANVHRGLLSLFGRDAAEIRRTEEEADRLSIVLLHNAGFPPDAAARFWRGYGRAIDGGVLRSPTHASAHDRAIMLEAAVADLPLGGEPICPAIAPGCSR